MNVIRLLPFPDQHREVLPPRAGEQRYMPSPGR